MCVSVDVYVVSSRSDNYIIALFTLNCSILSLDILYSSFRIYLTPAESVNIDVKIYMEQMQRRKIKGHMASQHLSFRYNHDCQEDERPTSQSQAYPYPVA